jgi:hypothetical protein
MLAQRGEEVGEDGLNGKVCAHTRPLPYFVIPAKAGTQGQEAQRMPLWVPAFAGMTKQGS